MRRFSPMMSASTTIPGMNEVEITAVSGAGFFNDLGHAVGEAHNALDLAIGAAFGSAFGLLKNHMYQLGR